MTRKHFRVVRHFLTREPWDYFHFVEIGLDRIHHGFWKHHDPAHLLHDPRNPYRNVVRDYYRLLDYEMGTLLEALEDETVIGVISDHGARPLDGGFCVNELLVEEGFLVLRSSPDRVTPLNQLDVDWSRTRAWSTGGYYARVFLNVRGREPEGAVPPEDYEKVRGELAARLEATEDDSGRLLGTRVFRPEDLYARVERIAPDLIVHFGDLAWRAIGGVGYGRLHLQENDTGPDDCNHDRFGAFVLAGPGVPEAGEVKGARLLDVAPTLLGAAGFDVPDTMQGRDLLDGKGGKGLGAGEAGAVPPPPAPRQEEALVRERLRGLGYLG
jgi:predicted AlkP superfamily phosphohydrolase/phosphomutase